MAHARRLTIPTVALAFVGTLTLMGLTPLEGPDQWGRLRAMPPELRSHLADQLKAFDLLSRAQQDAVRALDRKIASEPEESRALYYGVLRRYHLWVRSLPEAQREELNALSPADRLTRVLKLVAERKGRDTPESWLRHYADFGGVSPFDLAARIEVWQKLTAAQKTEIGKLAPADRAKRMGQYVREMKIQIPRPSATEIEAIYKRGIESGRFPFLKKAEETKKQANIKHRFVDNYYFIEHPPQKVNAEKLLEFEQGLPAWLRNGFDSLPAEETRRRLTILYRLISTRVESKPLTGASSPPPAPLPATPGRATPPPPPTPTPTPVPR